MALKKSALYSSLWEGANKLRGGMDASQYKDYVLVLLFVKYVSDKAAADPDALLEVPKGGSFADMVAAKGKKDIGEQLDTIIGKLATANNLRGILDVAYFNDEEKMGKGAEMVKRLTDLVAIFENPALNFGRNRAEGDDLLGDAYEYLMRHFATESGKSKGQFYTPSEVSLVMANLAGVQHATRKDQTIYDPTCGSGSLLLKAAAAAPKGLSIYGQERDNATYALARMNMLLHGYEGAELAKGNTLSEPATWNAPLNELKTHDFVVANPPFSTKSWLDGLGDPAKDKYGRFAGFGVPPAKNGDYAFLLHVVRSLNGKGKGVVVLPHGVLFRGNAEGTIRKQLVQRGLLKGIVGLPANLFYGTGIPAALLVLDKEGAHERTSIFMVDASRGFIKDGNKNRLREQDMHRIVDIFNRQADEPGYARLVPVVEIARNNFNLNLPRYVEGPATADHHDIEAHLRGGLPAPDLDALADYWQVYPSLRATLIGPADRPGYHQLRVAPDAVRPTIFAHPEFQEFGHRVRETFAEWAAEADGQLRAIGSDTRPKELLHTLAEELLATFKPLPLLDGYDVYQRLMDYWTASMQDDVYAVVEDGWTVRAELKGRQWNSELLPRELLIARYLPAEQAALDESLAHAEEATRTREELEEDYSAEEGALSELTNDKGRLPAKVIRARLKALLASAPEAAPARRGRKPKTTEPNGPLFAEAEAAAPTTEPADAVAEEAGLWSDELAALHRLDLTLSIEEKTWRIVRLHQEELEDKLGQQYADLSPDEVRDLLVHDKWLGTLHHHVEHELTRLSQRLAVRLAELATRYATSLPRQEAAVASLAQQVHQHLQAMGFSWN
ncbi:MAG: N-6 DNA methylase [Janthinobacterium lividum]